MSALGSDGVRLVVNFDEQHLPILNPINLYLQFLPVLQVVLCQPFDLVLFCHDFSCGTEAE